MRDTDNNLIILSATAPKGFETSNRSMSIRTHAVPLGLLLVKFY